MKSKPNSKVFEDGFGDVYGALDFPGVALECAPEFPYSARFQTGNDLVAPWCASEVSHRIFFTKKVFWCPS